MKEETKEKWSGIVKKIPFLHKPVYSEKRIHRMEALEKWAFLIHIPISLILCFVIEWLSRHSFVSAVGFVVGHPIPYLYNSFIIYVFYSLVYLVPKRPFVRNIVTAFFLVLGIINCAILANRVTPFGFTDLTMVGDLLSMKNSKYLSPGLTMLAIIALIVYGLHLVRLFLTCHKTKARHPFWQRLILVSALFISLPFLTLGLQQTGGLASYFGNLSQGYLDYGYLYGFSTSFLQRGMSKPLGYSETMIDLLEEKDDTEEKTTVSEKDGPNVIVVLLESYFDVSECSFLETSKDPIPYFHELEKDYSSGHLRVPVVGAGTCNTEFEVLTGMSCQFFGPGEYPQKTILKKIPVCESTAHIMDDLGYHSHVVHNNGGNFYSRRNAFSRMGFDTFTSKEMLDITDYTPLGSWPTDDILIDATKDAMDSTSTKDYVYTITVGTHGNYPTYKVLDDPAIKVKAKGKDEATRYRWEYYVNQLHTMDQWIRDYIKMIDDRGEDTLVVMFGDHLPTMGLTDSEVLTHDLYETKYITWNNFGMKKRDQDLAAYQLMSEYLGRVGVHDGTIIKYNQTELADGVRYGSISYMAGLEQLQYDLLYGKQYAYHGKTPYEASDIVMGIHPVTIDRAYLYNGQVHIYGDSFTKWSKVYVNGKSVPTGYESGQCLTVSADDMKNGDHFVVNQVGSGNTIFRTSNEFTFNDPAYESGKEAADPSDSTGGIPTGD